MKKTDLEKQMGCPVFMAEEEIGPFCNFASQLGPSDVALEIGTGYGTSSALLLCSSVAKVFSIDPFLGDSEGKWKTSFQQCEQNIRRFLGYHNQLDRFDHWCQIPYTSADVVKTWNQKINLLYIDGNHEYDLVRFDFDTWFPFVVPGGVLLIHDSRRFPYSKPGTFNRGWEGPTKLAEELRDDPRVTLTGEFFSMTSWKSQRTQGDYL